MVARIDANDSDFSQKFSNILHETQRASNEVRTIVTDILAQVQNQGDGALIELTEKLDNLKLTTNSIRFSEEQIAQGAKDAPAEVVDALKFAHDRIKSHHQKQFPQDHIYTDEQGVTLGTTKTEASASVSHSDEQGNSCLLLVLLSRWMEICNRSLAIRTITCET